MKKLGALILGAILTIGIGAGISVNPRTDVAHAESTAVYTLTPAAGSNNSYSGNCDIKIDGVTWNLTGNSTMLPWRLGGKEIANTDRALYSKTAISNSITHIDVNIGTASSVTVNSFKLLVGSTAGASDISELTATFKASSTITFEKPAEADWTNAYYKFNFNLTISATKNKYVQFSGATFYADAGALDPNVVSSVAIDESFEVIKPEGTLEPTLTVKPETAPQTVTWTSSNEDVATVKDGVVTGVAAGHAKITATSTEDETKAASFTVVVANHIGTKEDPLTVSDAIIVAKATGTTPTVAKYYVTGTVSYIKEYSTQYGNATLSITDGEKEFGAYRVKNVGGTNFADETAPFSIGSVISVYGNIVNYGGNTPQLNQYGELVTTTDATASSAASVIKTLAGGWNNNVATKECSTNYTTAKTMILALSAEELNTFKTSEDAEIASARAAYENWCSVNGDKTPYEGAIVDAAQVALVMTNNNITVMIIILASVLALAAAALLISKKRRLAK